ncbi:hypothetical protein JOQ06_023298, partial [Pogonophryne albipinna]
MKILLSCTVAMSKEKQPTAGLIIPILKKLEKWMSIKPNDSRFTKEIKSSVSSSLAKRYQSESVRHFLEEAAALDPRFKGTVTHDDAVWERLAALVNSWVPNIYIYLVHNPSPFTGESLKAFKSTDAYQYAVAGWVNDTKIWDVEKTHLHVITAKKPSKIRKSGLAELFEEEDEVLITHVEAPESDHMRAFKEVEDYRATRAITKPGLELS